MELRQLGTEYGLGIQVYNLEEDDLDDLPPGYIIQQMTPREFEAVMARVWRESGAGLIRPIAPGQAVTRDFRADRVNVHIDRDNRITAVSCG